MKFIFWHADKHGSFLQADIIILDVCSQVCPNYSNKEVSVSLQYSQKNVDFVPADKHESFL